MRAHGKLLLTGEYFVLDGALALAMPVRYGQDMTLSPLPEQDLLQWQSRNEKDEVWFEGRWKWQDEKATLIEVSDEPTAERLQQLFAAIHQQRPAGLQALWGHNITTTTDFPRDWGLGTSSTLVSLLAQHTQTNPYQLLADSFGGSGYDIACASAETPILYQRNGVEPTVLNANWNPQYADRIFFAYLGQKQNSREGIRHYRELGGTQPTLIDQVTALTKDFRQATRLVEAQTVLRAHEDFISEVLQMDKVQDLRFQDFPGVVKSLGAWGGDFVMLVIDWPAEAVKSYLAKKGYPVMFSFADLAL